MSFFRALSSHHWSLADLEGSNSLILAMFVVILLWIIIDRTPLTVRFK